MARDRQLLVKTKTRLIFGSAWLFWGCHRSVSRFVLGEPALPPVPSSACPDDCSLSQSTKSPHANPTRHLQLISLHHLLTRGRQEDAQHTRGSCFFAFFFMFSSGLQRENHTRTLQEKKKERTPQPSLLSISSLPERSKHWFAHFGFPD